MRTLSVVGGCDTGESVGAAVVAVGDGGVDAAAAGASADAAAGCIVAVVDVDSEDAPHTRYHRWYAHYARED